MVNAIEIYGLQVTADYRGVVFPIGETAFAGEGVLDGNTLVLSGKGRLTLSGRGTIAVSGFGELAIVTKGHVHFTIMSKVQRYSTFLTRYQGHIDGVVRLATTVELEDGASYTERTALRVTQRLDCLVEVFHAPHSTSDIRTRLVLEDGAKAIARGTIVIGKNSAGSQGSERIDTLLLGINAEVDVLPVLRVANDDVACNHAATVGHIDPAVVFYLASRGLAESETKQMLAEAFLLG